MQGGGGGVNHFPDRQWDLINENYRSNNAQLRLRSRARYVEHITPSPPARRPNARPGTRIEFVQKCRTRHGSPSKQDEQ